VPQLQPVTPSTKNGPNRGKVEAVNLAGLYAEGGIPALEFA
jgi:hypothetical protein